MSKYVCHCGNVISNSTYPSSSEFTLISESDWEQITSSLEEQLRQLHHAEAAGTKSEWIASMFGGEYPQDATGGEIVTDALYREITKNRFFRDSLRTLREISYPECSRRKSLQVLFP